MRRSEVLALAEPLRRLLALLDDGQLTASTATRHRIEGAVVALDVVLNERSSVMEALAKGDPEVERLLPQGRIVPPL